MTETHINAYYEDLAIAKQEAAAAIQRVVLLEEQILARGGELPIEASGEEDTSDGDTKALDKMNRDELDTYAFEHGIENPAQYETKKNLIDAIEASGEEA